MRALRWVFLVAFPMVIVAQSAPSGSVVPTIPERLPRAMRDSLGLVRASLVDRAAAFNALVPDFTARCGLGTIPVEDRARVQACEAEFAGLKARSDAITQARTAFARDLDAAVAAFDAGCGPIESQLAMDRAALVRQQRVSESMVGELEEWARESADAQESALKTGLTALFGSAAKQLESRAASADAFKGVLNRYEREMRDRGLPFDAMQERIERAARGYVAARTQAAAGTAMSFAADATELYKHAQTEAGVIARTLSESDADVKAALSDSTFRRLIQSDATGRDLLRSTLDQIAGTPALERIAPHYALASFVVDYGYESARWLASRERILQSAQLSDDQLKAVKALSDQMERTVARLRACRSRN